MKGHYSHLKSRLVINCVLEHTIVHVNVVVGAVTSRLCANKHESHVHNVVVTASLDEPTTVSVAEKINKNNLANQSVMG